MLVLNTSKDPEMGLLTNSLYVYNFIGTCWEFRMVEYFEIGHNLFGKLIMLLPLHVNVILFFFKWYF